MFCSDHLFVGEIASEFHVKRSLAHGKVCPTLLLRTCCQQCSGAVPPPQVRRGYCESLLGILNVTIIGTKVFVGNNSLLYGTVSHMWFEGVILDLI